MKTFRLALLSLLLPLAVALADDAPPLRLAILAVDATPEAQVVADLLMVKLSQGKQAVIVERSELDRVLREQELSAGGLTDPRNRVLLGRILKATGFVLVEREPRNKRLIARLVEVKQGFQACQWTYPEEGKQPDDIAAAIGADVLKSAGKLTLDPAQRVLVSIIRIGNATLSPDYGWIEDEMPKALGAYLANDPRILVLERRQLWPLVTEKDAASTNGFLTAGILLDGEVMVTGTPDAGGKWKSAAFVVRLRRPDFSEVAVVKEEGTLDAIQELGSRTAAAVVRALAKLGPQQQGQAAQEAQFFLGIGQAQTAYALDATNETAVWTMMVSLMHPGWEVRSRTEALSIAQDMARGAEVCKRSGSANARERFWSLFPHPPRAGFVQFSRYTVQDDEISEILRPVRQLLRTYAEQRFLTSGDSAGYFLSISMNFFPDAREERPYLEGLLARITDSPGSLDGTRQGQAAGLMRGYQFAPWVYERMAHRPEPELRFVALCRLKDLATSTEEARKYASEALQNVEQMLSTNQALSRLVPYDAVEALLVVCPELRPAIQAQVDKRLGSLIQKGDLGTLASDLPYLAFLPRKDAATLVGRAIALHAQGGNGATPNLLTRLNQLQADLSPPPETRVLLSSESSIRRSWSEASRWKLMIENAFLPKRFLLEGDTLWVGFALWPAMDTSEFGAPQCGIGLLELDLRTGRVLSVRFGALPFENRPIDMARWGLSGLARWGDYICVGERTTGVFLFPARSTEGDYTLANVQKITTKEGLFEPCVMSVAGLGDDLYIALEHALLKWNRGTKQIVLIANTTSATAGQPLGQCRIFGLAASPTGRFLYVAKETVLWRLNVESGEWREIKIPLTTLPYNGGWVCIEELAVPDGNTLLLLRWPPGHMDCVVVGKTIQACFDLRTEQFTLPTSTGMPGFVYPPGRGILEIDAVRYKGGTIATVTKKSAWKIVYVRERDATNGTALAWAPLDGGSNAPPVYAASGREVDSALLQAAADGQLDAARAALDGGAAVGAADDNGVTPLMYAASTGAVEVAELLLQRGAKVAEKSKGGGTALICAANTPHPRMVEFLLAHGAEVDCHGPSGITPLTWASYRGLTKNMEILIAAGADVNHKETGGQGTPLMEAASSGQRDAVKILLAHGAVVDAANSDGRTALALAATGGSTEIIDLLITAGADVNHVNVYGGTPLVDAVLGGRVEAVKMLLAHGAAVGQSSHQGHTVLMLAAAYDNPDVLRALIRAGADVNARVARDGNRTSALMMAAMNSGRPRNVRVLLEAGATFTEEDLPSMLNGLQPDETSRLLLEARSEMLSKQGRK